MEVLGSQHVPQGGGGQQPGGLVGVLHVDHGVHGVENLEVNHSINSHSTRMIIIGIKQINLSSRELLHGVLGEDLLGRHVESTRS